MNTINQQITTCNASTTLLTNSENIYISQIAVIGARDVMPRLYCGNTRIFYASKDLPYQNDINGLNLICSQNIIANTYCANNGDSQYIITYSTSSANILPTFTYGELLTNYFLFIIIIGCITGFLLKKFVLGK